MKPKSNLNDGEELLGIYQDNSRWIDRLFSTASKRTVGFSTEINQFLPIVIGNLYITNQRVIFEDKASKNVNFSIINLLLIYVSHTLNQQCLKIHIPIVSLILIIKK